MSTTAPSLNQGLSVNKYKTMNNTNFYVDLSGACIYDADIEKEENKIKDLLSDGVLLEQFDDFASAKSELVKYWISLEKQTRKTLNKVKSIK